MKAVTLRILTLIAIFSFLSFSQKSTLSKVSPSTAAILIETTLDSEGHPVDVEAKATNNGWDFEIDLLRSYTEKTMPSFLGTMIGAISSATRYTSWKSNRVYIKTSGLKFAWITTKACRDIAHKIEIGELKGNEILKALQKEMHMLI